MNKKNYSKNEALIKKCQLEDDKVCDNCCSCYICDLNPSKVCNNCAECLNLPDYNSIIIDDILLIQKIIKKKQLKSTKK